MAIQDYLSSIGYEGGGVGPVQHGPGSSYLGLFGDQRFAELLRQQGQTGALSPASVNAQTRQLVEGGVASEAFRQDNLARSLQTAGVNPAIAQRILAEDQARMSASISSQVAGFEGQRQDKEFQAGKDFVGFTSSLESELTARAEDARRYKKALREAKKARTLQTIGLGLQAVSLFLGNAGGIFGKVGQGGGAAGGALSKAGASNAADASFDASISQAAGESTGFQNATTDPQGAFLSGGQPPGQTLQLPGPTGPPAPFGQSQAAAPTNPNTNIPQQPQWGVAPPSGPGGPFGGAPLNVPWQQPPLAPPQAPSAPGSIYPAGSPYGVQSFQFPGDTAPAPTPQPYPQQAQGGYGGQPQQPQPSPMTDPAQFWQYLFQPNKQNFWWLQNQGY